MARYQERTPPKEAEPLCLEPVAPVPLWALGALAELAALTALGGQEALGKLGALGEVQTMQEMWKVLAVRKVRAMREKREVWDVLPRLGEESDEPARQRVIGKTLRREASGEEASESPRAGAGAGAKPLAGTGPETDAEPRTE